MARRTRDGHPGPAPASSHGTGHPPPWPLRWKSHLHMGLQPRALRPVPGYRLRLMASRCELRNTRDHLGSRSPHEPLRSSLPGQGWSARGGVLSPAGGLVESGKEKLASLRSLGGAGLAARGYAEAERGSFIGSTSPSPQGMLDFPEAGPGGSLLRDLCLPLHPLCS